MVVVVLVTLSWLVLVWFLMETGVHAGVEEDLRSDRLAQAIEALDETGLSQSAQATFCESNALGARR
jgi:hypothetical protein